MAIYTAPLPRLNAALTPPRALNTPSRSPPPSPLSFPPFPPLSLALFRLGSLAGVEHHRRGVCLVADEQVSPSATFWSPQLPHGLAHLTSLLSLFLAHQSVDTDDTRASPDAERLRSHLVVDTSIAGPRRARLRLRRVLPITVVVSPSSRTSPERRRISSRAVSDRRLSITGRPR